MRYMAWFGADLFCLGILGAFICREAANLSLTEFTFLKKMSVLEISCIKKCELNKGCATRNESQNSAGIC